MKITIKTPPEPCKHDKEVEYDLEEDIFVCKTCGKVWESVENHVEDLNTFITNTYGMSVDDMLKRWNRVSSC